MSDSTTPQLGDSAAPHLGIVVEAVEQLPEQDERAEQKVDDADPEDAASQLVRQLAPLAHPLIVGLQVPVVLEWRAGTPCRSAEGRGRNGVKWEVRGLAIQSDNLDNLQWRQSRPKSRQGYVGSNEHVRRNCQFPGTMVPKPTRNKARCLKSPLFRA